MLFILTGERQSGKTRWLMGLIDELATLGVTCHGVVSPGVWRRSVAVDGSVYFEKLGIEAVLLPQRERLALARGPVSEQSDGDCNLQSQSKQAGLGWAISDTALEAVNMHFDRLMHETMNESEQFLQREKSVQREQFDEGVGWTNAFCQGLLVIDELGKLELDNNGGFSSAIRQLEAGPSALYGNALAVVRNRLQDTARERLEQAWGGSELITPDECGAQRIIRTVTGSGS